MRLAVILLSDLDLGLVTEPSTWKNLLIIRRRKSLFAWFWGSCPAALSAGARQQLVRDALEPIPELAAWGSCTPGLWRLKSRNIVVYEPWDIVRKTGINWSSQKWFLQDQREALQYVFHISKIETIRSFQMGIHMVRVLNILYTIVVHTVSLKKLC